MSVETAELERLKFAVHRAIPEEFANEPTARVYLDQVYEQLAVQLQVIVLSRTTEEIRASYPVDWWQHVKQRFAPRWFLCRWPVKETEIILRAVELYPKIALPHESHVLRLMKFRDGRDVT